MGEFKYGFCGCFNNTHLCIVTWFLPCVTAGRNSEIMGDNCLVCGALYCIASPIGVYYQALNRQKIREQRSIEGSFGGDCLVHLFCPLCALVQDAQEIQPAAQAESMARE
uniref:Protein PLANT CADMIUM RESISTANCE 3-like isoform X2 n=1 Tax=Crassostrea virginica TaxID=6565 RepID=A0A8B8BR44_CRAVI|nr:protein PLANT CADMIUM RESISTANCE 3-like isoform X2 [Crassostrea virginica]